MKNLKVEKIISQKNDNQTCMVGRSHYRQAKKMIWVKSNSRCKSKNKASDQGLTIKFMTHPHLPHNRQGGF